MNHSRMSPVACLAVLAAMTGCKDLQSSTPLSDNRAALFARPMHHNDDPSCKTNSADPWEVGARVFRAGASQPGCFLTNEFRPTVQLTQAEASQRGLTTNEHTIAIANIGHMGKWYATSVPLNEIRGMYFHIVLFPIVVAGRRVASGHAAIRVEFERPLTLRPNVGGSENITTSNLQLSVNATGSRPGYDPFAAGMDGSYAATWGVYTIEHEIWKNIIKGGNSITQYQLEATPAQRREVLAKFLNLGNSFSLSRTYHTVERNCGNEQFYLLDQIFTYTADQKRKMRSFGSELGEDLPSRASAALLSRGLILGERSRLPNVEDDPELASILEKLRTMR